MKRQSFAIVPVILVVLSSCSSGKKAYERGDYVNAVFQAVERLRGKPDNAKAQEALRLAYPLAVDFLESQAASTIASDAPFKYKQALQYFTQINQLHDEVKTSPSALRVVRTPVSKFQEIADLRKKAAEESYEAGIQAMMKNSRSGAIQAYYLFAEANQFEPGIRDVVELQTQAEFDATLRVVYTEQYYRSQWVVVEPTVNNLRLSFTKFYTPQQAEQEKVPIHHTLLIEVLGYAVNDPTTTKTESVYTDSVEVERTQGGKKVKVKEAITAQATLYEKKATSQGKVRLTIKENDTNKQLLNNEVRGTGNWSESWARCSGDNRAIPERIRRICSKKEPEPDEQAMLRQVRSETLREVETTLSSFYRLK